MCSCMRDLQGGQLRGHAEAVRQATPRKSATRNALGAIGGGYDGEGQGDTLGHPPAIDPHDTRRQCVPNGLDGPGSRPGPSGRKAGSRRDRQRWAGTWFSHQSPRDRAPALESATCAAFSGSGFCSVPPANQASAALSPDRICQSEPHRKGLLASGHAASNIASGAPYHVPRAVSTVPEARDGSPPLGRPGGLGVPGSHFLAGLAPSLISRTCRHNGRSRWSRCLAAQLLDIPVRRPGLTSHTVRGIRTRPDALPVCAYRFSTSGRWASGAPTADYGCVGCPRMRQRPSGGTLADPVTFGPKVRPKGTMR
jgi:hypothetical protein